MCDERLILLIRVITECTWRRMHNVISSPLLSHDLSLSLFLCLCLSFITCERAFSAVYLKSDLIRSLSANLSRHSSRRATIWPQKKSCRLNSFDSYLQAISNPSERLQHRDHVYFIFREFHMRRKISMIIYWSACKFPSCVMQLHYAILLCPRNRVILHT